MPVMVSEEAARRIRRLARVRKERVADTLAHLFVHLRDPRDDDEPPTWTGEARLPFPDAMKGKVGRVDFGSAVEAVARKIPSLVRATDLPRLNDLTFSHDEDGDLSVRLPSGLVFYESASVPNRRIQMHRLIRDLLPDDLSIEEYHLSVMAHQRFLKYVDNIGRFHFPQNASVAVDAGAYVGYRAIAMSTIMGPQSKTIAIEMDDNNFRLLQKNVRANQLDDRVIPVHATLSDHEGVAVHYRRGTGGLGNTILPIALSQATNETKPTTTLARIFDSINVTGINYLNVQLNGAEPLALVGLGNWIDRVDSILIACPHLQGEDTRSRMVASLRSAGFAIVEEGREKRIIAHREKALVDPEPTASEAGH